MTFQDIQIQLHSLETRLEQAHTYDNVLALKTEIASLIIAFNDIQRTNISKSLEAIWMLKNNIKNLRENYRRKIQNLRTEPKEHIVPRSPIDCSESDFDAILIWLKKLMKGETEDQVESDYKDVLTRRSENQPPPYVCIMDENVRRYYVGGLEAEFNSYTRFLLSTVRPEYPLEETEYYQQSIVPPEPKENTDSDYKDVKLKKPQYQPAPFIASIPGSDFKRVSPKK